MRVLLTADTAGGVWTYAVALARELKRRGAGTTIAAMGPEPPPDDAELDVRWRAFALEWMPDPWPDVERAGEWLLDLRDELAPDVVHVNGFAHASLPWGAPVLLVAHSDVLTWWDAVRGEAAPPDWDRYRTAVAEGLRAAEAVAAPTRAYLDALRREIPFETLAIAIPNGLPPAAPKPKKPYVTAVGRLWDDAKNVAALRRVERVLPWPLRVEGRLPPAEFDDLLGRASIFAAPALYEPFGLAALHAGSAGCALVLGDVPTLREVWGDAAEFVDPRDDAALAAALLRLIENEPLRRDLARRARERASVYTAERMGDAYASLYQRLLAKVAA